MAREAGLSVAEALALGSNLASTIYWLGVTLSKPLKSWSLSCPI